MTQPAGNLVTPVGFDGSGKLLPLLFDEAGRLITRPFDTSSLSRANDNVTATSTGAGSTDVNGTTVPANKIYRLTAITVQQNDIAARAVFIDAKNGTSGVVSVLTTNPTVAAGGLITFSPCTIDLVAGDFVFARVSALAITKTVQLWAWYTVFDVTP